MIPQGVLGALLTLALILVPPMPAPAEVRIGTVEIYLNDVNVTAHVVLLGAIPPDFSESIDSGIPSHVRFTVEFWHHRRMWPDRRLQARTIERQLLYDVLTREFKVVSVSGETREPYTSRELREAQRVLSELRELKLMPAAELDPDALFYLRVKAEAALSGENTFVTRMTGDAEETDWVVSPLLTVGRTQ
jgi:hypothetical protein